MADRGDRELPSQRLKEHDRIRDHLDGQIPGKELKKLKHSLETRKILRPKFLNNSGIDFSDIFRELCSKDKIGVGEYDLLIELFEMIGLIALAKELQKDQDNFPPKTAMSLVKSTKVTKHGHTETTKPDPNAHPHARMNVGSQFAPMDVGSHIETRQGAAKGDSTSADPYDLPIDQDIGYYNQETAATEDQIETGDKTEGQLNFGPAAPLIRPARLQEYQEHIGSKPEAELMQCDADEDGNEGLVSTPFIPVHGDQPQVYQRDVTDATRGLSRMHIDTDPGQGDRNLDPTAEVFGDSRDGSQPPNYSSIFQEDGTQPQAVPGPPQQAWKQSPKPIGGARPKEGKTTVIQQNIKCSPLPVPPAVQKTKPHQSSGKCINQTGNASGVGNISNIYCEGGTISITKLFIRMEKNNKSILGLLVLLLFITNVLIYFCKTLQPQLSVI